MSKQPDRETGSSFIRYSVIIAVITILYVLSARLGLALGFVEKKVTLIWPPAGIALAAILLYGYKVIPGVALGAFIANASTGASALSVLFATLGNSLESLLGAYLLKRVIGFQNGLNRLKDVLGLFLLAAVVSTAISTTIGVTGLCLAGDASWKSFVTIWGGWWIGDAMGILIVTPLLLALFTHRPVLPVKARSAETIVFLVLITVMSYYAFGLQLQKEYTSWILTLIIFPFLILGAFRYNQPVVSIAVSIIAFITIGGVIHGYGPFSRDSLQESFILLLIFMTVLALTIQILSAVVSERRLADEMLLRSEARLEDAQRTAHLGNWDWDILKNELVWSDEIYRIFGLKPKEFGATYEAFLSSVHPEDREFVKRSVNEALYERKPYSIDHRILLPDGTERVVHEQAEVTYDEAGRPVRMVGTVQDITESKRAEDAIKDSEKRLKTIIDSLQIGILIIDAEDHRIVDANPMAVQMFGAPKERIIGEICHKYICPAEKGCCPITDLGETVDRSEKVLIKADGRKVPILKTVNTVVMDGREYMVESFIDITERKQLEAQLFQSQKMEVIGLLTGGIAHDFNNILTAIMGYGNILQMKTDKNDPMRHEIDQILIAAERAAQLTGSLLAFSRKQVINPRPIKINCIVKGIEKMLTRLIGEDIELRTYLSESDLTIMADSVQLEQILINLATNSRDAMPEGGLLVIKTEPAEIDRDFIKRHGYGEAGSYALLTISDTGTGMDREIIDRIFEPFFTTKEVGKGTGLGLSVVYGIIKQHNGFINVYSEKGEGTTFRIYLPLVEEEVETAEKEISRSDFRGTETILLAEDDRAVRELTKNILEESGYQVIEAVDGKDALEKFASNKDRIQFLLLDVIMPQKNGKEVYEEIRKISPDIKVLFTSGYAEDIVQKKGISEKGLNFISKPVSPSDLLRKIRDILSG
jgi:PAS domain S-box-containing protein